MTTPKTTPPTTTAPIPLPLIAFAAVGLMLIVGYFALFAPAPRPLAVAPPTAVVATALPTATPEAPAPPATAGPTYAHTLAQDITVHFAPTIDDPHPIAAGRGYDELLVRPDGWTQIRVDGSGDVWTQDLHPPQPTPPPPAPVPPLDVPAPLQQAPAPLEQAPAFDTPAPVTDAHTAVPTLPPYDTPLATPIDLNAPTSPPIDLHEPGSRRCRLSRSRLRVGLYQRERKTRSRRYCVL
jgi:hypothetical protein